MLLLSILQTALAHFDLQSIKMSFATVCLIFISQFLTIAVPTIKNLGELSNNLFGLFNFENCAATEAVAMHVAKMTFFMIYYGF